MERYDVVVVGSRRNGERRALPPRPPRQARPRARALRPAARAGLLARADPDHPPRVLRAPRLRAAPSPRVRAVARARVRGGRAAPPHHRNRRGRRADPRRRAPLVRRARPRARGADGAEVARALPGLPPAGRACRSSTSPTAASSLPERCIVAHVAGRARTGAVLRARERVLEWEETESGVRVRTDRGVVEAERLVLTAGAWSQDVARLPAGLVRGVRQSLAWLQPTRPELFAPDAHARLQPRARRRALLRLSRLTASRASSSAATTTSARAATRTRSRASRPRRRGAAARVRRALLPGRRRADASRSRPASSSRHPTSTSSSTGTRSAPRRSSAPASRDTASSSARSSERSSPTWRSTARRATTSGSSASTASTRRRQVRRGRYAAGCGAVRAGGLEPPRAEAQRDLNPSRLPVPPRPRGPKDRRASASAIARRRANGRRGARRSRACSPPPSPTSATMARIAAAPSTSPVADSTSRAVKLPRTRNAVERGRRVYVPSPSPTRNAAPNTTIPSVMARG